MEIKIYLLKGTQVGMGNEILSLKRERMELENQLGIIPHPEMALYMVEYDPETHKNCMWIADSGASTHMGMDDKGMTNTKIINHSINVGSGEELIATKWVTNTLLSTKQMARKSIWS